MKTKIKSLHSGKFRLPAEWESQMATILALPNKNTDWKPYLTDAREKVLEIATQISHFQKVILLCDEPFKINNKNIKIIKSAYNDTWCRDFAPISLLNNGKLKMLDFIFNGWGLKYSANLDNNVFRKLSKSTFKHINFKRKNFILEGGSIDTNGKGIILTTSRCLLESNRNVLSKNNITKKLKKYLKINEVIYLENGALIGDDTDSHIDNLARFVNENTIVYLQCSNKNDPNFMELQKMELELKSIANKKGFYIVPIPMPKAIYYNKRRLPASYINFLFINNAILVPTFGDKNDKFTIECFKKLLPNHDTIPIDSRILIRQGGGVHCMSMQIPESSDLKL